MRCGENYEVYHFLRGDDPKEWTLQEVTVYLGNIEAENVRMHGENDKLRAENERQANVLDNCAHECAEEKIRLESIISDMCNEARELRAEVARLRAAMQDSIDDLTTYAEGKASFALEDVVFYVRAALGAGKEEIDA
jgi:regulator of replication initiation timing